MLDPGDWLRPRAVWGAALWTTLAKLGAERKRYGLQMLGGSYLGYARSTRRWWAPVAAKLVELFREAVAEPVGEAAA